MTRKEYGYKFSAGVMLAGIPVFVRRYVTSRAWKLLLPALPGVLISGILLHTFTASRSVPQRESLQQRYTELSELALQQDDRAAAEVYLTRLQTLSKNPQAVSFDFATRLYEKSLIVANPSAAHMTIDQDFAANDPLGHRALVLLQSLAPRRPEAEGYPPAHLYLADHWESRQPATDVTTLLKLQHRAFGQPDDVQPSLQLAEFLTRRKYFTQAVDILERCRNRNPHVLLALAVNYSKLDEPKKSQQLLEQATDLLKLEVAENPTDRQLRMQLSQALAAQNRILESIFVLAEGARESIDTTLTDQLILRYTVWLRLMAPQRIRHQLNDIQLALSPSAKALDDSVTYSVQPLQLSTGESVSLPQPIVSFHAALLAGEGQWLVPLLLGTDLAAQQNLSAAIELLEEAAEIVPEHPVVANNLAWCLLQQHTQLQDSQDNGQSSISDIALARAWQLAEAAVAASPDSVSFRETRGLIAAATNRWQIALDDLQICEAAGLESLPLRDALKQARINVAD